MGIVRTTPAGSELKSLQPAIEELELRTSVVTLQVRELADGGITIIATPAAAADRPGIVVEAVEQGRVWRARIRVEERPA